MGIRDVVVHGDRALQVAFLIAMLAAFTVCLVLWKMIVMRRNGRERRYLERLKRELADL